MASEKDDTLLVTLVTTYETSRRHHPEDYELRRFHLMDTQRTDRIRGYCQNLSNRKVSRNVLLCHTKEMLPDQRIGERHPCLATDYISFMPTR
jgi:hypothetical protein